MKKSKFLRELIAASLTMTVFGIQLQADLSPPIARVLGKSGSLNSYERLHAISKLSTTLSPEDRQALLTYLKEEKTPSAPFSESYWYAYINDLMDILGKQHPVERRLPDLLRMIFKDQERPAVIRDYAIQHLGNWLIEHQDREALETLHQAAAEVGKNHAATAILALQRVSAKQPERQPKEEVAELAQTLLGAEEASDAAKASALQVVTTSGNPQAARALAQKWALDAEKPLPLRLSAIAVLGAAGDVATLQKLEQQEEVDPWLKAAANKGRLAAAEAKTR